jgi:putative Holliday junction resolvase
VSDSSREPTAHERLAGIDYGTVRIGIALADSRVPLATPLENYTRRSSDLDAERFRRLVEEEEITRFVVGLPVHLDGGESAKSREARQFADWLRETTGLPVDLFDERFTSSDAEELLQSAELTSRQRKSRRDKLAAQIMLTSYLESPSRGCEPPLPLDD